MLHTQKVENLFYNHKKKISINIANTSIELRFLVHADGQSSVPIVSTTTIVLHKNWKKEKKKKKWNEEVLVKA